MQPTFEAKPQRYEETKEKPNKNYELHEFCEFMHTKQRHKQFV